MKCLVSLKLARSVFLLSAIVPNPRKSTAKNDTIAVGYVTAPCQRRGITSHLPATEGCSTQRAELTVLHQVVTAKESGGMTTQKTNQR